MQNLTDEKRQQAKKEELLDAVREVDPNDPKFVEPTIQCFCRVHHRSGKPNTVAQESHLGRVQEREKLEGTLQSTKFAKSPQCRQNRQSVLLVNEILQLDTVDEQKVELQLALRVCRGPGIGQSFHSTEVAADYDNYRRQSVACWVVLDLGSTSETARCRITCGSSAP